MLRPIAVVLALALAAPALRAEGLDLPVSIKANGTELGSVVKALCLRAGLNVMISPEVQTKKVNIQLAGVPLRQVFRYLAALHQVGIALTPDERTVLVARQEVIDTMDVGESRTYRLANREAEKTAALLNKVYAGKVQAIADPRTNSVIVVPISR